MYYSKKIGKVRFLFLNSNVLPGVYNEYSETPEVEAIAAAQMEWLTDQLKVEVHPTIVLLHHAFLQTAKTHRDHAQSIWNKRYDDDYERKTLPEILIDGGVDLVLTGHVHSYEIFKLERSAKKMWSVNVSGRPERGIFNFPGKRMPKKKLKDQELKKFMKNKGFKVLANDWKIFSSQPYDKGN